MSQSLINVQPLQNRVIVKVTEIGEKTIGSFVVPDVAKERPQEGIVLGVGTGLVTASGAVLPIGVEIGDTVIFGKYAGTEYELNDGEKVLFLNAEEILGVKR